MSALFGCSYFLYAALVFAPPAAAFDKNVWKCLHPYIFRCYNVQNAFGGFFMNRVLTEQLIYEILSVVEEIPEGCVASYGQTARLIRRENNARLVGAVLSRVGIPSQQEADSHR